MLSLPRRYIFRRRRSHFTCSLLFVAVWASRLTFGEVLRRVLEGRVLALSSIVKRWLNDDNISIVGRVALGSVFEVLLSSRSIFGMNPFVGWNITVRGAHVKTLLYHTGSSNKGIRYVPRRPIEEGGVAWGRPLTRILLLFEIMSNIPAIHGCERWR